MEIGKSKLWKKIARTHTDKLQGRFARASLVWEEKKERVGRRHCAYCQLPRSAEGIAKFIATG